MPSSLARILQHSKGNNLVPLTVAAPLLSFEAQTIRNRLSLGTFPLKPHRRGKRVFFDAGDMAHYLDGGDEGKGASVEIQAMAEVLDSSHWTPMQTAAHSTLVKLINENRLNDLACIDLLGTWRPLLEFPNTEHR